MQNGTHRWYSIDKYFHEFFHCRFYVQVHDTDIQVPTTCFAWNIHLKRLLFSVWKHRRNDRTKTAKTSINLSAVVDCVVSCVTEFAHLLCSLDVRLWYFYFQFYLFSIPRCVAFLNRVAFAPIWTTFHLHRRQTMQDLEYLLDDFSGELLHFMIVYRLSFASMMHQSQSIRHIHTIAMQIIWAKKIKFRKVRTSEFRKILCNVCAIIIVRIVNNWWRSEFIESLIQKEDSQLSHSNS